MTDHEFATMIKDYIEENGYSPTYRDMQEMLDVASLSTVKARLERMAAKGLITYAGFKARTVRVL